MSELLGKLEGGQLLALVLSLGGMLVAVLIVAIHQWRRVRVAEMTASLKQQMLEKGMSADEIAKVMAADRGGVDSDEVPAAGQLTKAALVGHMAEHGYEAPDIERVVRAMQEPIRGTDSRYPQGLPRDKALVVRKMIDQGYEAEDIERVIRAYESSDSTGLNSDVIR